MPTALTKRAIKESFIKLLNERPLNKISVKDITDQCGINRNSFYYHFQDIPALMEEILTEQIDAIIAKYSDTDSLDEFFDVAFGFVLENKKALYHIYCSSNRESFEQMLMKTCQYIVTNYMDRVFEGKDLDEYDREIMTRFVTCSCFGAFAGWMMDGMKDNVMDDVHRIRALIKGFLDNAVNSEKK